MDTLETEPSGIFINGPVSCWNVKASFFRWVSFMISFESFQFIYYVSEFFVFYAIWHVFNFDEITSIYSSWTILPSSKYFFCKVEEPVSCSLGSLAIKFWLWITWFGNNVFSIDWFCIWVEWSWCVVVKFSSHSCLWKLFPSSDLVLL